MRVIGGEFRSRLLETIPGGATRPTSDRLRETLFNILQSRIRGAMFVDAYAGIGAVGIEALSRGAAHVYFLESARPALQAIGRNLASLKLQPRATVYPGKVLATLERCPPAIVFLDPPYDQAEEYTAALELLSRRQQALVIAQHSIRLKLEDAYGPLTRTRLLKQGDSALSFFAPQGKPDGESVIL
jgi:16S rRNA (guanine(966)-N(2))-methyltransferase RsmD